MANNYNYDYGLIFITQKFGNGYTKQTLLQIFFNYKNEDKIKISDCLHYSHSHTEQISVEEYTHISVFVLFSNTENNTYLCCLWMFCTF